MTANIQQRDIASVQLLRAIAALSIVYYHGTVAGDYNLLRTGSFGVDIFYIISGFINAYVVAKNSDKFFIKRIVRIVPLYFLGTIAMTLTVMIFPDLIRSTTISFSGFIKSILFIPGPENRGFPILAQGWTLNYEMFFYLVMFLCILFVKNKRYLTVVCASILVLIMALPIFINSDSFIFTYYCKNSPFLKFIYGILLYHCYNHLNKTDRKYTHQKIKVGLLIGLAIISYAFMILRGVYHLQLPVNMNTNYGIPALILVISLLFLEKSIKINNKIIMFGIKLGEASFVMYLIHYHVIIFMSRIIFSRIIGANSTLAIEIMKMAISLGLTIILSMVIYRFIDKPMQDYFRKKIKTGTSG